MVRSAMGKVRARLASVGLSTADGLADTLSPPRRYGMVRTVAKLTLRRELPSVPAPPPVEGPAPAQPGRHRCVLLANDLDTGGVEAVVALLALGLPARGLDVEVICRAGGRTAEYLRGAGVTVMEAADRRSAALVLARRTPDVVQVHYAPDELIEAALDHGAPVVPVLHNTELFRSAEEWDVQTRMATQAFATIAVSGFVAAQHRANLSSEPRGPIVVVPNGAPPGTPAAATDRDLARRQVGERLGCTLGDDPLLLSLARCEQQKNIVGLVSGFLQAVRLRPTMRLVVAGRVEDWLEYSRTTALAAGSPFGDRVHLPDQLRCADAARRRRLLRPRLLLRGMAGRGDRGGRGGPPLVMTEVGGARELIGDAGERGVLIPNPAGGPDDIDRFRIRRARRARVQDNRSDLVAALIGVVDEIDSWRSRRGALAVEAGQAFDHRRMVEAHARILTDAASSTHAAVQPTTQLLTDRSLGGVRE